MIEVKTQAEFNAAVASPSGSQMTRIYPKTGGGAYELSGPWTLPSGAFLQGIHHPKIQFTGNVSSGSTGSVIQTASGASRVRVKGLELIGKTVSGKLVGVLGRSAGSAVGSGSGSGTYSRFDVGSTGTQVTRPGLTVEDCVVSFMDEGIRLDGCAYSRIYRNRTRDNRRAGIYVNGGRCGRVSYNRSRSDFIGIQTNGAGSVTLSDNQVDSAGAQGIDGTGNQQLLLNSNKIRNARLEGIALFNTDFSALTGNTAHDNGDHGFYLNSCNGVAVSGNVATDNTETGVRGNTVSRCAISGNVSRGNYYGIELNSGGNNAVCGNMNRFNSPGYGLYSSSPGTVGVGNHSNGNSNNQSVTSFSSSVPSSHNEF